MSTTRRPRSPKRRTLYRVLPTLAVIAGCAGGSASPPAAMAPAGAEGIEPPALACPYTGVYVAVSHNGSERDAEVAERIRRAFSQSLAEQGFELLDSPQDAYWNAFSMVNLSARSDSTFAWSVYMMAGEDESGELQVPFDFPREGELADDFSGYMLLTEVRVKQLEDRARDAALDTGAALLPHVSRMCITWTEVKALREELVREMERSRHEQKVQNRTLDLELSIEEPRGSADVGSNPAAGEPS